MGSFLKTYATAGATPAAVVLGAFWHSTMARFRRGCVLRALHSNSLLLCLKLQVARGVLARGRLFVGVLGEES